MSSVHPIAPAVSSAPAPVRTPAHEHIALVSEQIATYARIAAGLPALDAMDAPVVMVYHHRVLTATLDAAILELAQTIAREVQA